MSCSVGSRHGLDPTLLWLWCRPAAAAPIWPLAWEPPCAQGGGPKKQKNKQKKQPPNLAVLSQDGAPAHHGRAFWGWGQRKLLSVRTSGSGSEPLAAHCVVNTYDKDETCLTKGSGINLCWLSHQPRTIPGRAPHTWGPFEDQKNFLLPVIGSILIFRIKIRYIPG